MSDPPTNAVRLTLLIALAAGIGISFPLWLDHGHRFPVVRPGFGLPALAAPFDTVRLVVLFAAIAAAAFLSKHRWPVALTLALLFWLGLEDRVRWQPWPYQYALCLLPFLLRANTSAVLLTQRLVLVAIYLWGGIHKLSPAFTRLFEGTLAKPAFDALGDSPVAPVLQALGHTVAPLEIAIAVLLAVPNPRSRKAGCVLAVLLHVTIFLWFVLEGRNPVVWPWNVAMAVLVVLAFWPPGAATAKPSAPLSKPATALVAAVAVLTLLAPALAFRGSWPVYFAFHLYSGKTQRLLSTFTNATALERIPSHLAERAAPSPHQQGFLEIDAQVWCHDALRVALPSDDAVVLATAQYVARQTALTRRDLFFYRDYPLLLEERGHTTFTPDQALKFTALPPLRR